MTRTMHVFMTCALLMALLLNVHQASASPLGPCAAAYEGGATESCAQFLSYVQQLVDSWGEYPSVTIPESSMASSVNSYAHNWDENDVAYIPESTMDRRLDDMAGAEQEFVAAVMATEDAYQSEDAARAAAFYAEDAVSLPPGFPPSVGREAIQADLEFYFDSFDVEREFNLVDYTIAGETATRTGEWTQTLTPTDGSEPIVETGRCVLGFKKVNGEWKVAWEIWNTY